VYSVTVCGSDCCDGPNPITIAQIIKSSVCNEWGESEVQNLDLRITHIPRATQLRHHDVVVIMSPHTDILKIQSLRLSCAKVSVSISFSAPMCTLFYHIKYKENWFSLLRDKRHDS
jgi:hypothetical protein